MSKTIDERVVQMRFDNQQFESNVKTSMSTLEKLKQSLKLKDASKGLENVANSTKHFDISPITNGLETAKMKFSAFEVVAVTALANITNSAINTGKQLLRSLTVDQISAGWSKYGEKTASVQTIMNATGKSIDEVNGYLDKLMWFSDETSYGFTDMTSALGQLTSAGGDIDKLIPMITGIANATAFAGKGAAEFSRSIYNLNQSYSAGYLQYMDWRSLELAGVASKQLKQTFIDTAIELGKINEGEVTLANFSETLKDKWADTSVMEAAFGKFGEMTEKAYQMVQSGEVETASEAYEILSKQYDGVSITAAKAAQEAKTFTEAIDATKDAVSSGWMKTFELIFGNYEEAKVLWTDLANAMWEAFASGAETRNEMLQEWKDLGGRDALVESFWNAWEGVASIINPIKEAFRDIFPSITAERLLKITEGLRDFTAKLKLSESASAKLKSVFKGLFSIVDIGITFFKDLAGGVIELLSHFKGLSGGILNTAGSFGDWLSNVRDSVKESDIFGKAIDNIVGFLGKCIDKLKEFGSYVKGKFKTPGFETFVKVLASIYESIKKIGAAVVKVASSIGKALGNAFKNGDMKSLLDLVNGGIFTTILLGLKKWINGFKDFASEGKSFVGSIKDVLNTVSESLTAWQKNIKADIIKKIAISIGILAASLWVLSTIDSDKLGSALTGITVLFIELIGALKAFDKFDIKTTGGSKAAILMVGMSAAVLILASAMKKISSLNWNEIAKGLIGIAGLMTIAIGAMIALSKFAASSEKVFSISKNGIFSSKKKKDFVSMGIALIAIATSMKIFASAAKDLGSMNWEELAKGMVGIGVILAEVAGFAELIKLIKPEKMTSTGIALIAIGASMKIFASAAKDFATMNWEGLGKAGAAIGGILLLAAGFAKLSSYSEKMISSSIALVIIGAAMEIFADVCKKFGQMDWEALGKAGAAIGGILLLASGFVLLSGLADKMTSSVVALTIIAAAMEIFADVCNKFGQMDWEALGKAGAAIGGILALAAGFAILCNLAEYNMIETAASLLIMAAALRVLTPVLVSLGDMSWSEIVKGLVTIAGAFTIMGVAGLVLGPVVPTILSLSGAVALLGLGCLAAGIGITALAAGLGILSTITAASATAIVAALHIIVVGILDLIPAIIDSLTRAVVALCEVFIKSIPAICEVVRVLVVEVVKVLVECVPLLVDGALKLIVGVLEALVRYTPQIVDLIFNFLIAILDGISRNLPALIQAVVNVFKALFSGVIDALNSMDPDMLVKGIIGIGFMSAMMVALAAMAALTPAAMIGVVGFGAVITELAAVLSVLGGLAQIPGLEWLISEGGNFLQKIGTAIGQFVGGIVGGIAEGFTSSLPNIATDLSDFMTNITPFVVGASSIDSSMFEGVKALSTAIMYLTAADVVNGIASWLTGGSSMADFAEQLVPFGKAMNEYSQAVAGINPEAIESSASAGKMIAELASSLPNSGGVAGFFAGENDMDIFAKQLIPFGEAMKEYSNAVSGINPNSVENSAIAAKTLVELANNLPNSGGMASWFAGDNKLDAFAKQLIPFGKAMKEYGDNISGIKPDSVSASATAAMALVELANNLPNSGGMVSWFTGDNNLSSFASQLIPFGKGMKEYANSISGIDANAVKNSAIAAKAIVELSNNLPNSGGMVSWFTGDNKIGDFGKQLIPFGKGMKEYADSISGMDSEAVKNSATAGMSLVELAKKLPNCGGVVSWFTGDNKMDEFAKQLIPFGKAMKDYGNNISGMDAEAVKNSATAGSALVELATKLPNCGGLGSWFSGDNKLDEFARQLIPFGKAMKDYGDNISGLKSNAIIDSATAGSALVELAQKLPDCGGVVSWFTGDNKIGDFGKQLVPFGKGMKEYGDSISGLKSNAIVESATAGSALVELAQKLPNCGGLVSWFSGDNTLSVFAKQLKPFGEAMKEYGDSISGIQANAITDSATAGSALVELAAKLPNCGGVVSWFTGNSDLSTFGKQLKSFGKGIKEYGDSISGIQANAITNSATAAQALVELAGKIPEFGGVVSWFTGNSDLSTFGKQLVPFGKGIKEYGDAISGIQVDAITNSATAAQALVELSSKLPELGGMVSWFTGDKDLGSFGKKLIPFGEGLKSYSNSVVGLSIDAVSNSVTAAKSLNGISNELSNDGGLFSLLNSGNNFNYIMEQLVSFGSGLTRYSATIIGVNAEAVTNSATAAEALSKVATAIQNGSILSVFSGEGVLSGFSLQLPTFGRNLKTYSDSVVGVNATAVQNSATATGALVEVASNIRKLSAFTGEGTLDIFSSQLTPFGQNLKAYSISVSGINVGAITGSAAAAKELVNVMNSMSNFNGTAGVSNFVESLNTLGTASVNNFVNAFNNAGSKVSTAISSMLGAGISAANSQVPNFVSAGSNAVKGLCSGMTSSASYINNFVTTLLNNAVAAIKSRISVFNASGKQIIEAFTNGLRSGAASAKTAVSTIAGDCTSKIKEKYNVFYNTGGYVVEGFAAGISANTYKAEAQAKAMAEAAAKAAKEALDINSPSKVFRKIAYSIPEGFAQGIDRTTWMAEKSSKDMANSTVTATTNALSMIKDKLQNGIDAQPVMSPVVDMSSIKANNIQLSASVGSIVTKPVTSLSQIISDAQADINASNNEVVSAIRGLREDLNTMYSSDGQEVALYVDAKKLASTIAKPMNRQLNILSQRGVN